MGHHGMALLFLAVDAADLSHWDAALSTDTSSILSVKELYGFTRSLSEILAIPGFGSLVCVQVVEFKKGHCHAAGTQEERRNAYRRQIGRRVCKRARARDHQHPPSGIGKQTRRDTQVLAGSSLLCKRNTKWNGKTFAEDEGLLDGSQRRHLEQVVGLTSLESQVAALALRIHRIDLWNGI